MKPVDIFSMLAYIVSNTAILFYFFRDIPKKPGYMRYAWLSFVLDIPLYIPLGYPGFVDSAVIRQLLRILSVYCFQWMTLEKREACFYRAMYYSLIHSAASNIFMVPVLALLRNGRLLPIPSDFLNMVISRLLQESVIFGILYVMDRMASIASIKQVSKSRYLICSGLTVLSVYIRSTLRGWYRVGNDPYSISSNLLPLFVLLSILVTVVLIEYAFTQKDMETESRLQALAMRRQYEAVKSRLEADERTRIFRHDMKNHLMALRGISNDSERVRSYLEELLGQMETVTPVETGDDLINGILSDVAARASAADISINYHADFSCTDFIKDRSLCTIVSNALDNALEAAAKVLDADRRRIHLKTGIYANMFVMRFENYYRDVLDWNEGNIKTTKQHPEEHGYGLRNIKAEVEKYDGTVGIETTSDRLFRLTIMIPIPPASDADPAPGTEKIHGTEA